MTYDAMGNLTTYTLGATTRLLTNAAPRPTLNDMLYDAAGNEIQGRNTGSRSYNPRQRSRFGSR